MANNLESLFHKSFDLNKNVIFFPVRHHSPACSYHLLKVIEIYKPDAVLIEGPEDCNSLIKYIIDETTEPPFCIYTSYNDEEGKISEIKERYRSYYPFLDYSPEYVALKTANKNNIYSSFIDMPYPLMLVNETSKLNCISVFDDDNKKYDSNVYTSMLTKKYNCRSFSEFWEMAFEINGRKKPSKYFIKSVFALGYFMRLLEQNEGDSNENIKREYYMSKNIKENIRKYNKTIVIAGSFHITGIMENLNDLERKEKIKFNKYNLSGASSYIIPYSFEDADQKSGYKAGIEYPAFYQKVWKNMMYENKNNVYESAYEKTVMNFIMSASRIEREIYNITIPDCINAIYMSKSLATLRGKTETGVYELIDATKSAFIKGEISKTNTDNLEFMLKLLSGLRIGKVSPKTIVPPVLIDFRNMCKKYRIKTTTIAKQETTIDIIKNPYHYEKSKFFHQMLFLNVGFCRIISGPDYINKKNRNLAREIWQYSYKTDIETILINMSAYGVSIYEICRNIIDKKLKEITTADEISKIIINAEVVGINNFLEDNYYHIENIIIKDLNFLNLCECLNNISYISNIKIINKHINENIPDISFLFKEKNNNRLLKRLAKKTFDMASYSITSIKNTNVKDAFKFGIALKNLYSFSIDYPKWRDMESFDKAIEEILETTFGNSHIYGVCLAIKYKEGKLKSKEFSNAIGEFLESVISNAEDFSYFIAGILLIARDVLFTSNDIIDKIDYIVKSLTNENFLKVLPTFRYAFTALTPSEIERVSKIIALKYEIKMNDISNPMDISIDEIKSCMKLDEIAEKEIKKWGLFIDD